MILKIEYKTNNAIRYTLIDGIDKIDTGYNEDTQFINVYKKDRKKDDEFETILIKSVNVYLCNNEFKTLQIFRG